jgi:hypothetical protein
MIKRLTRSTLVVPILALSLVMPALVSGSSPTAAPGADADAASGNGCQGIVNAYAHVSANVARNGNNGNALTALTNVAARLGCDLTALPPVAPGAKPPKSNPQAGDDTTDETNETDTTDDSSSADQPDVNPTTDQPGANPATQQAKCDKIATKLQAAQAKPHGKSADEFARQADRWSCPTS